MSRILTINSGSSSVKCALYDADARDEEPLLSATLERIGLSDGLFVARGAGRTLASESPELPDHAAALRVVFAWMRSAGHSFEAAGHRIVHGGRRHTHPELVTPALMTSLEALTPLAPNHLPHEIAAIRAVEQAHASLPQVACFDTAFHASRPEIATRLPLPRRLTQEGILRYGFHGLSYEYVLEKLARVAGTKAAAGRVIIAHLGNGASMAAVRDGRSMDTTMGLTPTGGLMMSTRAGDIDPGVIFHLIDAKGLKPAEVKNILNHQAGLLGVSGASSDVKDLLEREVSCPEAREALDLFCYLAKKHLGALAAVIGGLDTLVFTGGIGENAAPVRARICLGLEYLGVHLDLERNGRNEAVISVAQSPAAVRVIRTNEAWVIARHTEAVLRGMAVSA